MCSKAQIDKTIRLGSYKPKNVTLKIQNHDIKYAFV